MVRRRRLRRRHRRRHAEVDRDLRHHALGVGGELNPIRKAIDEFKPDITFNLLEAARQAAVHRASGSCTCMGGSSTGENGIATVPVGHVQSPIRIKRSAVVCFRPGGFAAPEERWCRFVSNGFHRLVAAGLPAPTPGWLTLQAIRFTARVASPAVPNLHDMENNAFDFRQHHAALFALGH